MYGTVAKIQVKPGAQEAFSRLSEIESGLDIPGMVAQYIFQMDEDPNQLYLIVMFKDKQSYVANAESPEQHERYLEMMHYLAAEPEWHDGEIIYADRT